MAKTGKGRGIFAGFVAEAVSASQPLKGSQEP